MNRTISGETHRVRKQIIQDKQAYVETVEKKDVEAFDEVASSADGEGTVIRVFFGATTRMPLRALSYVTAAARVACHIPFEQLQFISVNTIGNEVNGIPLEAARENSQLLAEMAQIILQQTMPGIFKKTIFAEDTPNPAIEDIRPLVVRALGDNPQMQATLAAKGAKHGNDCITYGAAHVANQDTSTLGLTIIAGESDLAIPERIVAVGCQQERFFYGLRMAVRELMDPAELIPSVQVFTKHTVPPYYQARQGEQSLADACTFGIDETPSNDLAARRDLDHLFNTTFTEIVS